MRDDVKLVEDVARSEEIDVRIVGGAVRDAFLKRKGGDIDLVLPNPEAARFAELLAKRLGTRVVAVGVAPRQVLKIACRDHEIDIWETEEEPDKDLLRRDMTINALAFDLPGGTFAAPEGALRDLAARYLAPPRPGVFLEDPLRVLRAARFLAELPGFRISTAAVPELRQAAPFLRRVAPERILAEMDRLLSTPPKQAAHALTRHSRRGALLSFCFQARRRVSAAAGSLSSRNWRDRRRLSRARFSCRLSAKRRACFFLEGGRVQRRELQMLAVLLTLSSGAHGRRRRPHRDAAHPARRIVEFLRVGSPFFKEAVLFLRSAGGSGAKRFLEAIEPVLRRPASLSRILRPPRPLDSTEVSRLLGLPEGPALGAALRELDVALAAGELRGKRAAVRFLEGLPASGGTPSR